MSPYPLEMKRERILEGHRLVVDRVSLPTRDGGVAQREAIVHPGSVVVLPLLDDDRIVMIRNERFAVGQTLWELCAGTLEADEEPAACARRELVEETGYRARELQPLLSFYPAPGMSNEHMYAFVARGLTHEGQRLDPTEHIEVARLELTDVETMMNDGRIIDGKTLAVLLYWLRFAR